MRIPVQLASGLALVTALACSAQPPAAAPAPSAPSAAPSPAPIASAPLAPPDDGPDHDGRGAEFRERRMAEGLKRAGVEDARAAQVLDVARRYAAERKPAMEAMRENQHAMHELLRSDSQDQAAYTDALAKLKASRDKLHEIGERQMAEMSKLLKPSEQAKLLMMFERHMHRMHGRHGRGGPGGDRERDHERGDDDDDRDHDRGDRDHERGDGPRRGHDGWRGRDRDDDEDDTVDAF